VHIAVYIELVIHYHLPTAYVCNVKTYSCSYGSMCSHSSHVSHIWRYITLHYKTIYTGQSKNCKVHYGASHTTMSGYDCRNKCLQISTYTRCSHY